MRSKQGPFQRGAAGIGAPNDRIGRLLEEERPHERDDRGEPTLLDPIEAEDGVPLGAPLLAHEPQGHERRQGLDGPPTARESRAASALAPEQRYSLPSILARSMWK